MSDAPSPTLQALLEALPEGDRPFCRRIADLLTGLGYRARKGGSRAFAVQFVHPPTSKAILKMGLDKDGGLALAVRFSAAERPPAKFREAVGRMARAERYIVHECCGLCQGRSVLYSYELPDGTAVRCCGAYALPVEGLAYADLDDLREVLLQQHAHFESLRDPDAR